ncbi:MAG TPA: hypothetical protein VFN26_06055 [Candidatus Acidoferrum sp.]|nr:hypothetical protein [Candidatus Acidoferrum sp.]
MNPLYVELLKAGLNLLIALVTISLGWLIGQRLTVRWNLIQKRRETDITNIQQFYSLYGEFKEVSKVWRLIKQNSDSDLMVPADSRWSLLVRACEVESKNEAIMVKLATERQLEEKALKDLGLFRQAIQTLRESIRDNVEVPFASRGPEYMFFNDLAARIASIISSSSWDATSHLKTAGTRLEAIANVRSPDFKTALDSFRKAHPEY